MIDTQDSSKGFYSLFTAVISFASSANLQELAQLAALVLGCGASIFAMIYYNSATKVNKKKLDYFNDKKNRTR